MLSPDNTDVQNNKLLQCRTCPRLRSQLRRLRLSHPGYWNLPVEASGAPESDLLIVGLAPGKHGANKTGIPFHGDASGDLLFKVLKTLRLETEVRITNAVKCLPIDNKPSTREISNCQKFLVAEVAVHLQQSGPRVILALGQIAHRSVIRALGETQSNYAFGHGAVHCLAPDHWLVDSYHCSRYNTQTGRLTESMFLAAVQSAARLAGYPG